MYELGWGLEPQRLSPCYQVLSTRLPTAHEEYLSQNTSFKPDKQQLCGGALHSSMEGGLLQPSLFLQRRKETNLF